MLTNLIQSKIFYVTITADRLRMRYINERTELEIEPTIAIDKNGKIIAVSHEFETLKTQNNSDYKISNGFKHPRTCISDFVAAEAILSYLFKKLRPFLFIRPIIIIQPLEKLDGNITMIETRALRELGESVGARKAYVWVGKKLIDQELLSLSFLKEEDCLF